MGERSDADLLPTEQFFGFISKKIQKQEERKRGEKERRGGDDRRVGLKETAASEASGKMRSEGLMGSMPFKHHIYGLREQGKTQAWYRL
jgi:hypothetical protein